MTNEDKKELLNLNEALFKVFEKHGKNISPLELVGLLSKISYELLRNTDEK